MKLTVLLMTITLLQVHAAGYAQTVTLSQRNISLDQAFKEIRKQTGYAFLYTDEQLQQLPKVSLELKNASLQTTLDACFQGQPLTYSISGKVIIIKRKALQAPAEMAPPDQEIKGRITNEKGEPLPGVTVQLKGTTRGVVTNENGEYTIT
ncbi:MAG TPA: STN and carboxypeptidase regulatory-like domain-containing protein, partial [Chitinophaga sp.]|uniref:STN and carboxypeptidase regulatory-like domain-containing protein n=1 Tax=Chitinophaga sp. TaxID=1869181 RepID=UPI002F9295F6